MPQALALQVDSLPGPVDRARLRACLEEADALKLDSVWIREAGSGQAAHLQHCAAALALAGRTRICVCGVALPLHQPVRVAEDLATLDAMRGGRIELALRPPGPPESSRLPEAAEHLRFLRRAWSGEALPIDPFPGSTATFQLHPRPAGPAGPPLWIDGLDAPDSDPADWAVELGTGLLAASQSAAADYLAGWKRAKHEPGSARVALQLSGAERVDVSAARDALAAVAHRIGADNPTRLLGILRHQNLEESV